MRINSLKKLKNNRTAIRAVDIQETDMLPTQYTADDTVPNYVFLHTLINPFFNAIQLKETADNIVDLLKGTRNVTSLQYDGSTIIKVMAINFATTVYILMMDAFIQSTCLIAHNDTVVMRDFVKTKFGVTDTAIDTILNNREDYKDALEHAKDKVFSKLVKLGHFEEAVEKYIYDMRDDDQSHYTTKITYTPSFLFLRGDAKPAINGWVSDFINKLYGSAIGVDGLSTSPITDFQNTVKFESVVTDPASWQKRLDDACEILFNVTEYRAFKTEYNNLYMYDSLWDITTYKVKSYFDDSEAAVLMNTSAAPIICEYDTSMPANSRYTIRYYYVDAAIGANDINSIAMGLSPTLDHVVEFGDDVTKVWIPDQNAGFSGIEISSADEYQNYFLKHVNKIVNIHKQACARDAEFMAIAGTMPQKVEITSNGSEVEINDYISFETLLAFTYAWSTHIKDGMVRFGTTKRQYDAPLAYRCYDNNNSAEEIRSETAAATNVFGLPALVRLYSTGSDNYQVDAIQDLYDLYELTPNSLYDARKELQAAIIETGLKIADGGTRVTNFAQVLEAIKRGSRSKSTGKKKDQEDK